MLLVSNRLHVAADCRLVASGAVELDQPVLYQRLVPGSMRFVDILYPQLVLRFGYGESRLQMQPVIELDIAWVRAERTKGRVLLRGEGRDILQGSPKRARTSAMQLDLTMTGRAGLVRRPDNVRGCALMFAVARGARGNFLGLHIRVMRRASVASDAGLIRRLARNSCTSHNRRQIDSIRSQGVKIAMALVTLVIPSCVDRGERPARCLALSSLHAQQQPDGIYEADARSDERQPKLAADDSVGLPVVIERHAERPLLGRLGDLRLGVHGSSIVPKGK